MPDTRSEIEAVAASLPSEDSQSSTPADAVTTPSETPVTPTTQEAGSEAPATQSDDDESTLPSVGAIPVERVKKIIANARHKAATEVEGRFSWAKDVDPEQFSEHQKILGWLDTDPIGFHNFVQGQLKTDPRYASHFTREEPQPDPEPKPDLMLEDGTLMYSPDRLKEVITWRERQWQADMDKRLSPLEKAFQSASEQASGIRKAQEVLSDAKTWPGFEENMTDIRTLMEADKRVTLESAYRRVVVPKLQAKDRELRDSLRKEILNELKQKPAASTEVPGRVAPVTPESFKGKSTEDVMRSVLAEMGG
jgi:hypothetical protein